MKTKIILLLVLLPLLMACTESKEQDKLENISKTMDNYGNFDEICTAEYNEIVDRFNNATLSEQIEIKIELERKAQECRKNLISLKMFVNDNKEIMIEQSESGYYDLMSQIEAEIYFFEVNQ